MYPSHGIIKIDCDLGESCFSNFSLMLPIGVDGSMTKIMCPGEKSDFGPVNAGKSVGEKLKNHDKDHSRI